MTGTRYRVGNHNFYNEADYLNAKKDEALIADIRKKTNFRDRKQVQELYGAMQSGKIAFFSALGREFDDEVYETYQALKQQPDPQKARSKKKDKRAKTEQVRISHASKEDLDKKAKKLLRRRDLQRRLFLAACGVVAAVCIGYFGYYQFMASRTQNSYDALAALREKSSEHLPDMQVTVLDETGEEELVLTVLDEYKTLYNKNRSLIGWLKIDDTNIDYPVMQSPNPDYYLTHNFNQEHDNNGSIFFVPFFPMMPLLYHVITLFVWQRLQICRFLLCNRKWITLKAHRRIPPTRPCRKATYLPFHSYLNKIPVRNPHQ